MISSLVSSVKFYKKTTPNLKSSIFAYRAGYTAEILFKGAIECFHVLEQHFACVSFELPLSVVHDEKYFGPSLKSFLQSLKRKGYVATDSSRGPTTEIWNYIGHEARRGWPERHHQSLMQEDHCITLIRHSYGRLNQHVIEALIGVSGVRNTTLMDVLAGQKTGGYTKGNIFISIYPKNQSTFARVSDNCEQNDVHSPNVIMSESLLYSAWLCLFSDVDTKTSKIFVEELMELVELHPLRNVMGGIPGVDGLTIEQQKRLTIAVKLVANPSIIFMDEPISGLDARAATMAMRTIRKH
nr:plant PDR ABC transporter associated [Tanacetum cinerariifolium]